MFSFSTKDHLFKYYRVQFNAKQSSTSKFSLIRNIHGGFVQFFPTGTYTGVGTSVSSLKHVMKSTKKKHLTIPIQVHRTTKEQKEQIYMNN